VIPQEAFLSHSDSDRGFVEQLANVLRHHGVPVWYSRTNIVGAQQWQDEIGAALGRCDWFLLVLSPRSLESMWVKRELSYVLQQPRFENKIAPILYESCDFEGLPWVLPIYQLVDFTQSPEAGYRDLLRLWGLGYRTE